MGEFDGSGGRRHRRRVRHRAGHGHAAGRARRHGGLPRPQRSTGCRRRCSGSSRDVTDDASVRAGVAAAAERARRPRRAGQQRRHRRRRHGRGQPRRRVAPGAGRQRRRHGPGHPRRPAAPARVRRTRRSSTPARSPPPPGCPAGALQRDQGRGAVADPGDGRRPRARGHPGQLRQPGHRRHAVGAPPARRRRRPRRRAAPRSRPPAHRPAGQRRGGGGRDRLPGRARSPAPPPAPSSPSTAACTACACGRRRDRARELGVQRRASRPARARLRAARQPVPRDRRRAAARATVDAAWGAGVRYFDTAPHYGLGLSERRLGAALRERPRDELHGEHQGGPAAGTRPGAARPPRRRRLRVPATHRRVWDFSRRRRTAVAGRRASTGSASTGSTSCSSTTPRSHADMALDAGATRPWRSCATRAWSARSARASKNVRVRCTGSSPRPTSTSSCSPAATRCWSSRRVGRAAAGRASRRGVSVIIAGVFNSGLLAVDRPHGATADYEYGAAPADCSAGPAAIADGLRAATARRCRPRRSRSPPRTRRWRRSSSARDSPEQVAATPASRAVRRRRCWADLSPTGCCPSADGWRLIVDAHHHLWRCRATRYTWLDEPALAPIRAHVQPRPTCGRAIERAGVARTVLVEGGRCDRGGGGAAARAYAGATPADRRRGGVGRPAEPASPSGSPRYRALPGGERLVGDPARRCRASRTRTTSTAPTCAAGCAPSARPVWRTTSWCASTSCRRRPGPPRDLPERAVRARPPRQAPHPRRRRRAGRWRAAVAALAAHAQRDRQALRPGHRGRLGARGRSRTCGRSWPRRSSCSAPSGSCSARTGRCACSPPRTAGSSARSAEALPRAVAKPDGAAVFGDTAARVYRLG